VIHRATPSTVPNDELSSDDDDRDIMPITMTSRSPSSVDHRLSTVNPVVVNSPIKANVNFNGSASPYSSSSLHVNLNVNRTSIQADIHNAAAADSSDDMEDNSHVVVLKDEDVSDTEHAHQVQCHHHLFSRILVVFKNAFFTMSDLISSLYNSL